MSRHLQIINGQFVEGFYIYSREIGANGTYKMLTVLHGGGASACTMTGLAKYRQYEFFIVPFYKTVDGRPSNSRVARTLEDGKWGRYFCSVNVHSSVGQSIRDGYPSIEEGREGVTRNQIWGWGSDNGINLIVLYIYSGEGGGVSVCL